MKYALAIAIALVAQACGRAPSIDPRALAYVQQFEKVTGQSVWVDVVFDETIVAPVSKAVLFGQCRQSQGVVRLNEKVWRDLADESREQIVFHELGHCVLFRGHNDTMNADNQPVSYMHSLAHPSVSYLMRHKEAYRAEMTSK